MPRTDPFLDPAGIMPFEDNSLPTLCLADGAGSLYPAALTAEQIDAHNIACEEQAEQDEAYRASDAYLEDCRAEYEAEQAWLAATEAERREEFFARFS